MPSDFAFGFSVVGLKLMHTRWVLRSHGLQPLMIELDDGSTIHIWAPATTKIKAAGQEELLDEYSHELSSNESKTTQVKEKKRKPALVLLHGFGADGTMAWEAQIGRLSKRHDLYVPDLLWFGKSRGPGGRGGSSSNNNSENISCNDDDDSKDDDDDDLYVYSEVWQAERIHAALRGRLGVSEAVVCGHSYGGFVGYRMAHLYPGFVRRLVLVSSGVMMGPHTNEGLLKSAGAARIEELLVPPSPAHLRRLLPFILGPSHQLPTWLPNFIYHDLFESMSGDRDKRLKLVKGIILGKENAPPLPKVEQDVLIIWGDEDQIFNIDLAYQLKDFLGHKAELAIIKGVGHVPAMSKPKEFNLIIERFLANEFPSHGHDISKKL